MTNGGRKKKGLGGVRTNWCCTQFMSFIQVWTRENWGEGKKGRRVGVERGVLEESKVNNGFSTENNLSCYLWCFGLRKSNSTRLIRNGARVVIADLPTSDGDNVAKELGENSCYFSPTGVSETECIYKSCSILLLSVFFSLISSYFL